MSFFPHTITVFTYQDDKYSKQVVNGVYWYGERMLKSVDKSMDKGNAISVVIPLDNAKNYGFKNGDIVVKGEYQDIQSIEELDNMNDKFTITAINTNDVGSSIDNVVISGV